MPLRRRPGRPSGHGRWSGAVPGGDPAASWLHHEGRRAELIALEVAEAAKTWPEVDGDVCEAINFVEY